MLIHPQVYLTFPLANAFAMVIVQNFARQTQPQATSDYLHYDIPAFVGHILICSTFISVCFLIG